MLLKIEEQWQFWILLDLRILKHPENVEFEEDLAEILKVKPLFQLFPMFADLEGIELAAAQMLHHGSNWSPKDSPSHSQHLNIGSDWGRINSDSSSSL